MDFGAHPSIVPVPCGSDILLARRRSKRITTFLYLLAITRYSPTTPDGLIVKVLYTPRITNEGMVYMAFSIGVY